MTFSHLDTGTDEAIWTTELASHDLPGVDLDIDALFVIAAHPDDETLGVGGLIHRLARRGIPITIMSLTDGERSHPDSPTVSAAELSETRRRELEEAVRLLAPDAELHFLGIPDGTLLEHRAAIEAVLKSSIRPLSKGRLLVVAPWAGDAQRDHRIAGEAARRACAAVGARLLTYPIWLWHWGGPGDVPWSSAQSVALDDGDLAAKRAALAAHRTQTQPLSDDPGDEVMLHDGMRAHFTRDVEVLFGPKTPTRRAPSPEPAAATLVPGFFDAFYARNDDPWGLDSRWYEVRKRSALMASLPRQRYRNALELGCATGALTEQLAPRCDHLLAIDVAAEAIERAHRRLARLANVQLSRATIPEEWPRGVFDLIVFSEIGYYWTAPDLELTLDRMLASLAPDGHLVACHWRHPVAEHAVTGDGVHVALRTMPGLVSMVHHEEADFVLEVFARPPARSVAEIEGLTP